MFGLQVIVVQDRMVPVFAFNLPRSRCRTPALRKSYNRLRRNGIPVFRDKVVRFEDTHGSDCVLIGDRLYMSPRGYEVLKKEVPVANRPPAPIGALYGL